MKKKNLIALILCIALCASLVCMPAAAEEKSATVEMEDFNNGTLTVTVTVENDAITAVDVTRSATEASPGDDAVAAIPAMIVEANSADVDTVAGATFTSNSIITGVKAALAEMGTTDTAALEAWAEANGYVKAEEYNIVTGVDAVTSPTASGEASGLNFGYISFDQEGLGKVIAEALSGPYTWGEHEPKNVVHKAEDYVEGVDLTGTAQHREMVVLGNSYNNIPNTATIELVYDPYTSKFYGSSEAGTSKIQELNYNPYVTVTWVCQMNDAMFDELGSGYAAYSDYGKLSSIMVYGKVHFLTDEDFDGGEKEEAALRALDVYMPTYYGQRWPFKVIDPNTAYEYTDEAERAAKVEAAKTELQGVSAKYYIEPYRITFCLFSVYPPFAISEKSAWSTYKTYSIKTEEATEANGFTETWTGIRYWYRSDTSWDFTWSENGKELLAVDEIKDGDSSVAYRSPYYYKWTRDSFQETVGTLKEEFVANNHDLIVSKVGEDVEVTFTRPVLIAEKTFGENDTRKAGEAITADDVTANNLVLGTDYINQTITLPNYSYYLVTNKYSMSAVQSQQNYTPYPEANPVKAAEAVETVEEAEEEGVITDGTFNYVLLDDGTYEISKFKVVGGQSMVVELPAVYDGIAVTSVGVEAFKDATNIGKIIVPAGYTTFKEGAFAGVRSLKSMIIPETVTVIGENCFNRTGWGNMNVDSFCIIEFAAPDVPEQTLMLGSDEMGLDGTQVRIKVVSASAEDTYKQAWAGYSALISKDWVNPE